jgi:hypothetical protein
VRGLNSCENDQRLHNVPMLTKQIIATRGQEERYKISKVERRKIK